MRSHGEGEPHIHAAGIALHRGVQEFLHLGKGDDFIELAFDLGPFHSEDRAVQVNVFAPGQFRVKAGSDLQQAGGAPVHFDAARGRLGDAAEKFEQG